MRLLPRSTAGQLAAIVVLATLAAHVLAALIWFAIRDPTPPVIRYQSQRIVTVIRACTALSADACKTLLKAASVPGFRFEWVTTLPESVGEPDQAVAILAGDVAAVLAPTPAEVAATSAGTVVSVAVGDHYVQAWVGPRLLQRHQPSPIQRLVVLLIGTALPVLMLTLWGVRQVTLPLRELARAAGCVGNDGEPPSLPERGTDEVRKLARAFNGLLERLHRFISERTRTLAAVSHDLRTPLTRIRLRIEGVEDDALRERLLKDVRMMELMIGSSLSLLESQEKREPEESVDLGVLLQTICDEFADGGNDVTYSGPLRCPARCRPRALERAVNNVVDNALKFGGSARVALGADTDWLVIDIEDEGPGIPDVLKDDVLKPFYRGRSERGEGGGSGLGLAIAQTIVAGHGGAMALEDRKPQGLRVRLRLPRRRA